MLYWDSYFSHTVVGCGIRSHEITVVVLVLLVPFILARPHTEGNAADQQNDQDEEEDSKSNGDAYDGSNWKIIISCKQAMMCEKINKHSQ